MMDFVQKNTTACPHCGFSSQDKGRANNGRHYRRRQIFLSKGYSKPVQSLSNKSTSQLISVVRRKRLQCCRCKKSFSENYFCMNYRLKHKDQALNYKIFIQSILMGASNRSIARLLGVSECCVRNRLQKMAQRALIFQDGLLAKFFKDPVQKSFKTTSPYLEEFCFDGIENFACSQYEPNNLQPMIGRQSLFIYDFNLACLNRKGRMSDRQKLKRSALEEIQGRFNPKSIRMASVEIFKRIYKQQNQAYQKSLELVENKSQNKAKFCLLSDEHFQYRRAIERDLKDIKIDHITISSKETRNYQNILFAINHCDLIIRQHLACFTRETISFAKTHARMCQKFALFMVYKNFMRPQFTKKHVRRPKAHLESPAQTLSLSERLLEFRDIFASRALESQANYLNSDWRHFFFNEIPTNYQRSLNFV